MDKQKIQNLMEECFFAGVNYGQLLTEEERESEETFDSFIGHYIDKKYNAPSHPTERRQCHSKKWFEARRKGYRKYREILNNI